LVLTVNKTDNIAGEYFLVFFNLRHFLLFHSTILKIQLSKSLQSKMMIRERSREKKRSSKVKNREKSSREIEEKRSSGAWEYTLHLLDKSQS